MYKKIYRKRTYGFLERRNGVRPPEVFALSRYAENFEKELHFVQIFFKTPLRLNMLLANQDVMRKKNGRQKNELLQIAKITFPSSVFRHCIFGRSNKNTVTDFLLPKIFFLTFQKQAPRYSFQQSGIGLQNREVR